MVKPFLEWLVLAGLAVCTACGLAPAPTATASPTPSPTLTLTPSPSPTRTPTPTPTATFTPTPTPTVALLGTSFPRSGDAIVEANLPRVVELARWGDGAPHDLTWSPDGNRLALASSLGATLYDAHTLAQVAQLGDEDVRRVAFSPDGRWLATAGAQMTLWDVASGARVQTLDSAGAALAFDLRFSADGSQLGLLGWADERLQFERWDLDSGRVLETIKIGGVVARITTAVLSADFSLAAAHGEGPVQLFRTRDGASLTSLSYSSQLPGPMTFSPDGNRLAVGYPDQRYDYHNQNEVEVYRVPEGVLVETLAPVGGPEGSTEALVSLAYSPDGQTIAAGFANQTIAVWSRTRLKLTLQSEAVAQQLAFSPDGARLGSGTLEAWSLADGQRLESAPHQVGPYQDLQISPDGQLLAAGGYGAIELRNLADGSLVRVMTDLPGAVRSLSFYPSGATLAAAAGDGLVRLYQVDNGRFLTTLGEGGPPLWAVAFSPDRKWLAWGGGGQQIYLYDLEKDQLARTIAEPYLPVKLAFSPDGGLLASLTTAGVNVRLIDGELVRTGGGSGLEDMAFWLDGNQIALVGNDVARVMDINSGKDSVLLDFHEGDSPSAVGYTADGAFMAVGWSSGQIDLYWAGSKDLLLSLDGHRGRVTHIRFSRDGRLMVTYGEDGAVRVWGVRP